jgi:hypothetical protein
VAAVVLNEYSELFEHVHVLVIWVRGRPNLGYRPFSTAEGAFWRPLATASASAVTSLGGATAGTDFGGIVGTCG